MEATWEIEDAFRQQYPYLFKPGKFQGRNFFKEGRIVAPQKYIRTQIRYPRPDLNERDVAQSSANKYVFLYKQI
ncbi:Transposon Ty3-G Gag-Pol polyprotein [Gossypium australe]|uniref:Transposon Ty3-G Gag-Pol polyprotein n=1 Tax=Gossypium australe TaxID=47621 RepID=A0A5B6WRA3_9ROSI|nr:Transposon Ty3-G Gag-Pol polyprotein [Gossypium australe]